MIERDRIVHVQIPAAPAAPTPLPPAPPNPTPAPPPPPRPTTTTTPASARDWITLLSELRRQLGDPTSELTKRPWEHGRLYDALGRTLSSLHEATPGGLDWLERNG